MLWYSKTEILVTWLEMKAMHILACYKYGTDLWQIRKISCWYTASNSLRNTALAPSKLTSVTTPYFAANKADEAKCFQRLDSQIISFLNQWLLEPTDALSNKAEVLDTL